MNTIPSEIVDRTADWLFSMEDETAIENLINKVAEEQPFILAYLMAMGEGDFNEEERELLLFLGLAIVRMMAEGNTPLPVVTESHLDKLEQTNMRMLEYLAGETDAEFAQVAANLMDGYNQPEVLKFVIETILDESGVSLRPGNTGIMIIFLKIVIDCLDQPEA